MTTNLIQLSPKEYSACSIFARWYFGNQRSRKNKQTDQEIFENFQNIYNTLGNDAKAVIDCIRGENNDHLDIIEHLRKWERQLLRLK